MKRLYLIIALFLAISVASCQKSNSDNLKNYQLLDTGRYDVSDGTLTFKRGDSTFTYTAPNDAIRVYRYTPEIIGYNVLEVFITQTSNSGNYTGIKLQITDSPAANKTWSFPNAATIGQSIYINNRFSTEWSAISGSITVNDYNNNSSGILLNASFTGVVQKTSGGGSANISGIVSFKLHAK